MVVRAALARAAAAGLRPNRLERDARSEKGDDKPDDVVLPAASPSMEKEESSADELGGPACVSAPLDGGAGTANPNDEDEDEDDDDDDDDVDGDDGAKGAAPPLVALAAALARHLLRLRRAPPSFGFTLSAVGATCGCGCGCGAAEGMVALERRARNTGREKGGEKGSGDSAVAFPPFTATGEAN